jgi:hypothetical protein
MKTIGKFMLLVAIVAVGFGCELHSSGVPGLERVEGIVTNENGDLLQGIKIEAYNDEQLTDIYSPIGYPKNDECTDEKGYYRYSRVSRTHLEVCDVYVVAIDTTGIYERQVKKGQIKYVVVPIVDDQTGVTGSATVDFVLKKKQ